MSSTIGSTSYSAFSGYSGSLTAGSSGDTSGPDVFSSLSESYSNARKSGPNAWTQISAPQKNTPGSSKSVPLGQQRALRRDVEAADVTKNKVFDAGRISENSGRVAILGQVGAGASQDSYKISLSSGGKLNLYAPNPDYDANVSGSKISLGDAKIEVTDSAGKLIATTDTANGEAFSNWISLSTEGLGGLQVSKGDYTVKVTRDKGVADATKVNYTLYAVMGDPGATTFYTVKKTPVTAEEQRAQEKATAVSAAQSAAKSSSSSAILSLFA